MAELKGNNLIAKFRQVAGRLVSQISPLEGVAGIIIIGGIVRGFVDEFSDVDVIVFLSRRNDRLLRQIREMGANEQEVSRIDVDLEIHLLSDFAKMRFNELDKWDFGKAEIAYDPHGEVARVLKKKLCVSKNFWKKRVAVYTEYLKWYCCPLKKGVGTIAEAWIKRGDLASAHYCLSYAIELILDLVFALNKEFLPPPKWKLFCSYSLSWLPPDYQGLINEAMTVENLSVDEFKRRMAAIERLWLGIIPKIEEETGLTLDSLSRYYAETELHQTF
jgi:predicted nucleotidyltransferase